MNYTQFTNATSIQPFSNQPGSKFASITPVNNSGSGGQVIALLNTDDNGVQRIIQPIDASFPANFSINLGNGNNIGSNPNPVVTLPLTVSGKLDPNQAFQIQLVPTSSGGQVAQLVPIFTSQQTQDNSIQLQIQQVNEANSQDCSNDQRDNNNSNQVIDQQGIHDSNGQVISTDIKPNISDLNQLQQHQTGLGTSTYPITLMVSPDMLIRDHISDGTNNCLNKDDLIAQLTNAQAKNIQATKDGCTFTLPASNVISNSWPVVGSSDFIQSIQTEAVPLSIHQFLKLSAETIKRESAAEAQQNANGVQLVQLIQEYDENGQLIKKKKYRKKVQKARRPRPGQVHIATALDGTLLFCCPECNMAYPEKEVLEQHLVSHKIERRFICDICGAGLKRKEHLERHKLGHNPERPFICTVCTKGFKRKEHLNLHAVIHSGEKTEICNECGKGFYRRDHLRKHAKSHQSKRLRDELQYQQRQLHSLEQQQKQLQLQQQQGQKQRDKFVAQQKQREDSSDGSMLVIHEDGTISSTCSRNENEGTVIVGNEETFQRNGNAGALYEHFQDSTNESLQLQRDLQGTVNSISNHANVMQNSIDSPQTSLDGDDRLVILQSSGDDNTNESSGMCNGQNQMDDSMQRSSLKICEGIDNELKVTNNLMEPEEIL